MAYAWSVPTMVPTVSGLSDYKIVRKDLDVNKDGKLCDVSGNPLGVGNQVKISGSFECCTKPHTGIGTVMVLHSSGDWEGQVSVRWREGGVSCSVPDKALKIVARKPTKLGAVELQAFALYLRKEWDPDVWPSDEDVSRAVAEYMVGLMEATGGMLRSFPVEGEER